VSGSWLITKSIEDGGDQDEMLGESSEFISWNLRFTFDQFGI
jgi:hypothetical protein